MRMLAAVPTKAMVDARPVIGVLVVLILRRGKCRCTPVVIARCIYALDLYTYGRALPTIIEQIMTSVNNCEAR